MTPRPALSLAAERGLHADPARAGGAPAPAVPQRAGLAGIAAAAWGVAGQLALLGVGAVQLLRAALRGFATAGIDATTLALAAASVATLCYFQGYRGFQLGYARLVAARAAHLARHPRPLHALLAPLHVCGLLHATRRRRFGTALLFGLMGSLAVLVGRLPEPYRAVVDLGVACGLGWGTASVLALAVRAAAGRPPAVALDLPPSPDR
jgi:hypothetical protein